MSVIIQVRELASRLEKETNSNVIVDVRFQLNDSKAGQKAYNSGHLPGAVYFDLGEDLSGEVLVHGGNHPLPEMSKLAQKLGAAGITQDTAVIVYDQGNDMFAPRFWWLLQHMGHEKVYILDGGYDQWVKEGNSVTKDQPIIIPKTFIPKIRDNEIVDISRIKENIMNKSAILIDSRSKDRYLGKTEPLYKKVGHIPGARNYFWMDVFNKDGSWKSKDELEKQFENLDKNSEIIVSCGSGVSACPNILALKMVGYENIRLYPGSYSDWISYEENEIETKDETNG